MSTVTRRGPGRPPDAALRARRRTDILAAAARVFAARGYADTDLQVVAEALGVGKGTLYRYFPSKERLFLAVVDRGVERLGERVEAAAAAAGDPLDKIARAIRAYLAWFDRHPELVELLIQERAQFKDRKKPTYFEHQEAHLGPWRALFRGLIAAGRVRAVPLSRLIDVLSDLLYGTIFTNLFAGRRKSFEVQADDIIDIAFTGLLSDAERARHVASGKGGRP